MTSLEVVDAIINNKFNGANFNIWKFKLKVRWLLWTFGTLRKNPKELHMLTLILKLKKKYQRHVKKTMSNIALNLIDNQFAHIRCWKGPAETWVPFATSMRRRAYTTFSSFYANSLVQDAKNDDMLDHINKALRQLHINLIAWRYP